MADASFLAWPFFDDGPRDWAQRLERWAGNSLAAQLEDGDDDLDATYRCVASLVAQEVIDCSADSVSCRARPSSACIARSARCAFTKARARC